MTKIMMLAVALFLLLPFGVKVKAENVDGLEVKFEAGFKNTYKVSTYTPVNINIKNTYKDINGLVEVRVPVMDTRYESYAKSLSIQKDSEKNITINVPVKSGTTKYKVVIYDGEREVYSEDLGLISPMNEISKLIGVLSDDFEGLTYLDTMPKTSGNAAPTKMVQLDEKSFPESEETLSSFDVIIINNFDSSKLSKNQYENLKLWTSNGGSLIIGTGTNGGKSLGIFKDNFIPGTKGELKKVNTTKIYNIGTNGDNNKAVEIEVLNMNIEDSNNVLSEGNTKMVQVLKKGKGTVGLLGFDLGLAPFTGWNNNSNFGAKLYAMISPNLSAIDQKMNMAQNLYYTADEMLRSFSLIAAPKTKSFYIILIIYILVVAPLSYIILKKFDKREMMWVTVPALAVVFGIIVYVAGSGTRLTKVTGNMVNLIKINDKGLASEESYVGIVTPKKMTLSVKGNEGQKLLPLSNPYYNGPNGNDVKSVDLETRIRQDNDTIEFYNKSIFEQKILKVSSTESDLGKVESTLELKSGDLTGSIKNSTSLDLNECVLVTPKDYYKIGTMKSGEIISLAQKSGSYNGDINELIHNQLYNMNQVNPQQFNLINQKASMIRSAMMNNSKIGYRVTGYTLIAFSDTEHNKPLIINGKEAEKFEKNVVVASLNINLRNGDNIEYPIGFIKGNILANSTLNYDIFGDMLHGNGFAEIAYDLDKSMKVNEVEIDTSSLSKYGSNATLSIFNIKKNSFEDIKAGVISGEELINYIDTDNRLKLKVSLNNNSTQVPQIAAKGKVK